MAKKYLDESGLSVYNTAINKKLNDLNNSISILKGQVVDNLDGNSTDKAPSQRAVKDYLENIIINKTINIRANNLSGTFAASGWREVAQTISQELKAGTYLLIYAMQFNGTANGLATLRCKFDGDELGDDRHNRSSFPLGTNITTGTKSFAILELEEDGTHTFGVDVYANVSFTAYSTLEFQIIRLY